MIIHAQHACTYIRVPPCGEADFDRLIIFAKIGPPWETDLWQQVTNFSSQNRSSRTDFDKTNFASKSGPARPVFAGFTAKIVAAGSILG